MKKSSIAFAKKLHVHGIGDAVTSYSINSDDWVILTVEAVTSTLFTKNGDVSVSGIPFVNSNGNSFSNDVIMKNYKTFIGGHVYYNHDQDESRSYGFIMDAQIIEKEINEEDSVYSVQLLIAVSKTDCPNNKILDLLTNGKIETYSMGCQSKSIVCSKCGAISVDDDDECQHVKSQLRTPYYVNGERSIVSSVIDETVEFYEISLVHDPAYSGAVTNHMLSSPKIDKILNFKMPNVSLERKDNNGLVHWLAKNKITKTK